MEAAAPPPAPAPAPKRIDVGRVFSETFSIYGKYFGALVGSAIVLWIVLGIIIGALYSTDSFILQLLGDVVRLAGYAIYTGFVVKLVQDVRGGGRGQSIGDLFESATPAIVPLVVNGILFGFGVFFGFVLIIVPGLILLTIWSVCAPSIVVERQGAIDAFGRSYELVRGESWSVFGVLVLMALIMIAAAAVTLGIGGAIGGFVGFAIAAVILGAITAPIYGILVSVLFFDLGGGQVAAAPAAPAAPPPAAPPA